MRPGQNRRLRGRTRNKGPNPLTKAYESNGPDVKIRGTAQHVADKYAQLARDAQVSGDPVAAENYLQHAEHYYRLIAAVQEQYRQQFGTGPRPFDDDGDDGDEDAGPGGYQQQRFDRGPGGQPGDDSGDGNSQPQPYDHRSDGERAPRFDRGDRFDRGERENRPERFENRGDRPDNRNDRDGNRAERPDNRAERPDRGDRRDRFPRPDRPPRQDYQRSDGPRSEEPRDDRPRDERPRDERPRDERPRSDGPREERQARPDFNRERPRRDRDEAGPAPEPAGLPAFLTNPVRPPIAVDEVSGDAPVNGTATEFVEDGAPGEWPNGADVNGSGFAPRPRRRRRPRFEGSSAGAESPEFNPDNGDAPVD